METVSGSAAPRSEPKPPETGPSRATLGLQASVFALGYACFVGYLVYSAQWLPARVASHFGSNLQAGGWMPRQEFLLIIGVFL